MLAGEPVRSLVTIRHRRDYRAVGRARWFQTKSVIVQARHRRDGLQEIRLGLTCSRKVGNAVARNRSRRRLREAARIVLSDIGQSGWDYVLVGKPGTTATCRFDQLLADLRQAVEKVHLGRERSR